MSLTFDTLDRRVIDGHGNDVAAGVDGDEITYAQLVERSAALAGGLRLLGIGAGTVVTVDLDGMKLVVTVWALARLHALPVTATAQTTEPPSAHITGDPAAVIVGDDSYPLTTIELTGRNDPAPAPRSDPQGYRETLQATYPDIVAP